MSRGHDDACEPANIDPGATAELTVVLEPGSYVTACKPGMTGDGLRGQLDVTEYGASSSAAEDPELVAASEAYVAWVAVEADTLLTGTKAFAAAVTAGDVV